MIFFATVLSARAEGLSDGAATPAAAPRVVLEGATASLDVATRGAALAALISVEPDPCTSPWTRRGMADPAEYVQRKVIEALDRPGASPCQAELWSYVQDEALDPTTRGVALILVRGADPEQVGALAMALPPDGRSALLLAEAASLGHAASKARLTEIARSGNLPLDDTLYQVLGFYPEFPFAEALAAAEPEARAWIAAAWLQAEPAAGRRAVRALLHDKDEDRVFDMIEAVYDDPKAWSVLKGVSGVDARLATAGFPALALKQLDADTLERRLDAIRTLGRAPDARYRGAIRARYAAEEDDTVRTAIAHAVAANATVDDRALLTAMLGDPVLDVRVAAAAAMFQLFEDARAAIPAVTPVGPVAPTGQVAPAAPVAPTAPPGSASPTP